MNTRVQRWIRDGLLVALGLNLTGQMALGQANPPKSFLNKGTIHLPIQIDDRERPRIQEVQLYVKDGPNAPWVMKEKVPATQTFFTYRTPQDGEYWFNVATLDRTGKLVPANINQEPPGLIVVIDSTPPQVEANLLGSSPDGQQVRCEVRDINPEPSKTRFSFQTRDKIWRPLEPVSAGSDVFNIPTQAAITGMIRVVACDLAGNTTTREFNLSQLPVFQGQATAKSTNVGAETPNEKVYVMPTPSDYVGNGPKLPGQSVVISEQIVPFSERVEIIANKPGPQTPGMTAVEPAAKTPFAQPGGPDMRPTETRPAEARPTLEKTAVQPEVPAKRHLVNNNHVFLDYQIEQTGVSGVGRVEVWYTRDAGQSWQKLCEDPQRKGQAEIDLPGEGIYGVSIVVSNGRGFGAAPPNSGDAPDWWIEVDTTKPKAELLNVRSNPNGDDGSLHITWNAKDKNLHSEPIDLYYAVQRQGPWLPIAKGLKNDGLYRWSPSPEIASHAYIRLTVRDQAGNSASSDSVQPVALDDLSRPRGRVVGITTVPRTTPLYGSGPMPLPPQGN